MENAGVGTSMQSLHEWHHQHLIKYLIKHWHACSPIFVSTVDDIRCNSDFICPLKLSWKWSHNIMLDENGKIAETPPSWQHAHQILNHSISHIRHRKCFSTEESGGGRYRYQQLENGGKKAYKCKQQWRFSFALFALSRLASHKKVNAPEKDVFASLRSILIQSKVLDFAI